MMYNAKHYNLYYIYIYLFTIIYIFIYYKLLRTQKWNLIVFRYFSIFPGNTKLLTKPDSHLNNLFRTV